MRWKWRKCFFGLLIFFSVVTCLAVYIHRPAKTKNTQSTKYVFDLVHWQTLLRFQGSSFGTGKDIQQCDVPTELQPIADAICQKYLKRNCPQLPCDLVTSSTKSLHDLQCLYGGRVWSEENARQQPTVHSCKLGFALDLFSTKDNRTSYPSINTPTLSSFSDELYINVLHRRFRTPDSIWGFNFNFESITNYPWAADRAKLALFDVTFGYDRQLYDFVPAPWLFDYLKQLEFNADRVSLETAMEEKKPIHSAKDGNAFWPNRQTANRSSVTAPILWMNTNCHTPSKRTEYLAELTKFIDVDNYGNCGTNILRLPEHIVQIQKSSNQNLKNRASYNWKAGMLKLSSEYLFTIAIENSIDHDYITEKLWHPLVAGSIPIYLGAPNIRDWLPCETDCIVDLTQFKTHEQAAEQIRRLATNRTLYESYHHWRLKPFPAKFKKILQYFQRMSEYSLDCILCDMSHRVSRGEDLRAMKRQLKATIGSF